MGVFLVLVAGFPVFGFLFCSLLRIPEHICWLPDFVSFHCIFMEYQSYCIGITVLRCCREHPWVTLMGVMGGQNCFGCQAATMSLHLSFTAQKVGHLVTVSICLDFQESHAIDSVWACMKLTAYWCVLSTINAYHCHLWLQSSGY